MIGHDTIQQWWGNTVFKHTADWHATPLRVVPEGEHFGCVLACIAMCVVLCGVLTFGVQTGHLVESVVVALDVFVAVICCRALHMHWAWDTAHVREVVCARCGTGSLWAGVLDLGLDACMAGRVRALKH